MTGTRKGTKRESKKLKLKKDTINDLDAKTAKGVRRGMLFLSGKGCGVSMGCQVLNRKEMTVTCAKDCV